MSVLEEARWLAKHSHFAEKPASILEFLGEEYLNIEDLVRPGLKTALIDIFGEEVNPTKISNYERAMYTGGIGIGKTTFASIALPYMAHWTLCLRDPQAYFKLLPGSRIAFMQMSTSEQNAREVVFGDIFARIKHSRWFVNNYPHDPKFTKQIRFAKDIWILPGDSTETSFEGYNILAGILDEMDSHKVTDKKDYADVGYDAIQSRIASRFTVQDASGMDAGHMGLLICIGQMKRSQGFAARKYEEFLKDKKAHVTRQTIWESLGWERFTNKKNNMRVSFFYDTKRRQIIPNDVIHLTGQPAHVIEVPEAYRIQFETNPDKALRDLAGIPPNVNDPFISLSHKITEAREKWIEKFGDEPPVGQNLLRPDFADWFGTNNDPRRRAIHIDLATSGDGDALGMAMGHVDELVEIDGETKPRIVIDCIIRIRARPGDEIMLSDVRRIIYHFKDDLGFKIHSVTMDGFQSTDTLQQLRKRRINADALSVDKTTLPYEDLREAIYEGRLLVPPFKQPLHHGDTNPVEIFVVEAEQLTYTGKKVDHPPEGSKDTTDAVAGVVTALMGDRTYRKGLRSPETERILRDRQLKDTEEAFDPTKIWPVAAPVPNIRQIAGDGLKAPIPPRLPGNARAPIPPRDWS